MKKTARPPPVEQSAPPPVEKFSGDVTACLEYGNDVIKCEAVTDIKGNLVGHYKTYPNQDIEFTAHWTKKPIQNPLQQKVTELLKQQQGPSKRQDIEIPLTGNEPVTTAATTIRPSNEESSKDWKTNNKNPLVNRKVPGSAPKVSAPPFKPRSTKVRIYGYKKKIVRGH